MEVLKEYQLDLMLILSGICIAIAICGIFSDTHRRKKYYLFVMDIAAALLMISDRFAYIYRGNVSLLGFWMVRICNFLVFFLILVVLGCFNGYIGEVCMANGRMNSFPVWLRINRVLLAVGVLVLVISQFTGLYYTFDEYNRYQRADGFLLCYLIPTVSWILCFSVLIKNHRAFDRHVFVTLILFCILPIAASVAQAYLYGLSLNTIMVTLLAVVLRVVELVSRSTATSMPQWVWRQEG